MGNFVTDNTPLPPAKADAYPPVNPAQEVDAADINTIWGALGDVRTELGIVPSVTTITGPGTKNIVRGSAANSVAADVGGSTVAGGGSTSKPNRIGTAAGSNASVATIGGGYDNTNNMLAGTISGGAHHVLDGSAGGDHAAIAGGSLNSITTSGHYASIGAGTANTISGTGDGARIGGGTTNTASNSGAVIGGGSLNVNAGNSATIAGGSSNQCDANATGGSIGGGSQNQITGTGDTYGTISGGTQNHITGNSYGSVGGGLSNTVTGQFGVVDGGTTNTASGSQAVVGGGSTNVASGTRTAVLSGANNTAQTGDSACVINGQQNTASGAYATVRGLRGTAANYGQHTIAGGFFAVAGDAQTWDAAMRATTTDATVTSLTLDGAVQISIPDNTSFAFRATIVGRRTDASDNAAYEVKGLIKRDVGVATTAIVGAVATTVIAESDATWDATAIADTTNGRLTVRVTGAAAKTIRWVAHMRVASVSQ